MGHINVNPSIFVGLKPQQKRDRVFFLAVGKEKTPASHVYLACHLDSWMYHAGVCWDSMLQTHIKPEIISALTVLVQDLYYSDPLSSVLTISDPATGRDDCLDIAAFMSLCMLLHASMNSMLQ